MDARRLIVALVQLLQLISHICLYCLIAPVGPIGAPTRYSMSCLVLLIQDFVEACATLERSIRIIWVFLLMVLLRISRFHFILNKFLIIHVF